MTRDIRTDNQTASEAEAIQPVLFVELMFDEGPVRFHSQIGDITWGGNTYTGTGRLGSISAVEEESELARSPITMTLSGLPPLAGQDVSPRGQGHRRNRKGVQE